MVFEIPDSTPLAHCRQPPRSRHELAEMAGYSETNGGFASALAKLRTMQLIDGPSLSPALQ